MSDHRTLLLICARYFYPEVDYQEFKSSEYNHRTRTYFVYHLPAYKDESGVWHKLIAEEVIGKIVLYLLSNGYKIETNYDDVAVTKDYVTHVASCLTSDSEVKYNADGSSYLVRLSSLQVGIFKLFLTVKNQEGRNNDQV